MKRVISLLLCISILLTGCGTQTLTLAEKGTRESVTSLYAKIKSTKEPADGRALVRFPFVFYNTIHDANGNAKKIVAVLNYMNFRGDFSFTEIEIIEEDFGDEHVHIDGVWGSIDIYCKADDIIQESMINEPLNSDFEETDYIVPFRTGEYPVYKGPSYYEVLLPIYTADGESYCMLVDIDTEENHLRDCILYLEGYTGAGMVFPSSYKLGTLNEISLVSLTTEDNLLTVEWEPNDEFSCIEMRYNEVWFRNNESGEVSKIKFSKNDYRGSYKIGSGIFCYVDSYESSSTIEKLIGMLSIKEDAIN